MQELSSRLAEMNRQSREFWAQHGREFRALVSHPRILRTATERMEREIANSVPVVEQTMLEELVQEAVLDLPRVASEIEWRRESATIEARSTALAEAKEAQAQANRQRARKGGLAKKADPMTRDIRTCLQRDPKVTNDQLFARWNAADGNGLIHAFDGAAQSCTYLGREDEQVTITFANLRARISRERKNVRA